MRNQKNVLFLSYDGLTDPLGKSQILPYIVGLSKLGYRFWIISFEKKYRFLSERASIQFVCDENNISWVPMKYSSGIPVLSKIYDLLRFNRKAYSLVKENNISLVHARSYVSAIPALKIKRQLKIPFIFDMRGFWIDERVEGGIWRMSNPAYWGIYKNYRKKEKAFFNEADIIISLTQAGKEEIIYGTIYPHQKSSNEELYERIQVIPCAADNDLFGFISTEESIEVKKREGLEEFEILCYLGSIGTWYLLEEMLITFKYLKISRPNLLFFLYTPEDPQKIFALASKLNIPQELLKVDYIQRSQLREKLSVVDYGICYMRNGFSRKATSPVKFGEMQSMGIPMIVNRGIGDMEAQINTFKGGLCLDLNCELTPGIIRSIVEQLNGVDRKRTSELAQEEFRLQRAIDSYAKIYHKLYSVND